jgi:uncharacterized protein YggE
MLLFPTLLFSQGTSKEHYIVVNGYSEMEVPPNRLILSLSVSNNENLKKESSSVNMENNIVKFLQSIGIAKENFTVDKFSMSDPNIISSKTAIKKDYHLVLDKPSLLDTIVVQCMRLGIDYIYIKEIKHTRMDSLQNILIIRAVNNAKSKAQLIANQLNLNLGKAIEISEDYRIFSSLNNNFSDETPFPKVYSSVMKAERISSNIEVDNIFLSKTLYVKFEIY